MANEFEILHLLNKDSKGGAESLVDELVLNNIFDAKYYHKKMFISKSKFSIWLFKKRILRYIPILLISIKIIFIIVKNSVLKKKKFIFFHLAEGHLVATILSKLGINSKYTIFVIYLHQSKQLYPHKLVKPTKYLISRFPVICYSNSATKDWFDQKIESNSYRFILHNFISNKFLNATSAVRQDLNSRIRLIFVGRISYWKRPDLAIEFAKKLSIDSRVSIKLIGITNSEYLSIFNLPNDQNKNLDVEFIPTSNTIITYLHDSDLMIYLADSSESGESIGIAALEALSLGIPVLVKDKNFTDFTNFPGIFDLTDFQQIVESSNDIKSTIKRDMRLGIEEVAFWRKTVALDRYNLELESILSNL